MKVGDEVVSTNPGTGETGPQEVTATTDSNGGPTIELRDLVTISIDEDGDGTPDGDITATPGHAFWTADDPTGTNPQWTTARNLTAGWWLRAEHGTWVNVGNTVSVSERITAYNLSVLGAHTYYVVTNVASLLVHNCLADDMASRINISELGMTKTVANHFNDITRKGVPARPFMNSILLIQEIMLGSKPKLDPRRVSTAVRWDTPGALNGSPGRWELVIDTKTNTIIHFNFSR